jgi:hypothetical protein
MSRKFAIEGLDRFEALEQKLSMSVVGGVTPAAPSVPDDDDFPPPGPEPDPGPLPPPPPPIVLPPLPPSGPVGPG